jgi:hypothetical protein
MHSPEAYYERRNNKIKETNPTQNTKCKIQNDNSINKSKTIIEILEMQNVYIYNAFDWCYND